MCWEKYSLIYTHSPIWDLYPKKGGIENWAIYKLSLIHILDVYKRQDVQETGYGIVMPEVEELTLEEPQILKQNGKYGIRLKATAPSIHMMKTQIFTEITPIVGSEQQSEELVLYLLKEFEENPVKIWESNIFGKSLHSLVNEGMHNKLYRMPNDAREKVRETICLLYTSRCV